MSADDIKLTIRAANAPMYRAFLVGTVTVCSTIITSAIYVTKNFTNHEVRIGAAEHRIDKIEDKVFLTARK